MVKKIIFWAIFCIVLLGTYVGWVINKDRNLCKLAASYVVIQKKISLAVSDKLNSCSFSELRLKNSVELKCIPLKEFCADKIPTKDSEINKDTACAVITFKIPSKHNTNNEFQVLSYADGWTTIPNSVEHEFMFSKGKSFSGKIQKVLLFYDIRELLKKSDNSSL